MTSFLWWFIRVMEVANQFFFSAMDARFLHTSINYQKKAFYHLNDYTVYFAQLCRTMNILLRTQTHIIEVVY